MEHIIGIVSELAIARDGFATQVEVHQSALEDFYKELQRKLRRTVWSAGCSNWYVNSAGVVVNNWAASISEYWWATLPTRKHFQAAYKFS